MQFPDFEYTVEHCDSSYGTTCTETCRVCRDGYSGYAPFDGLLFIGSCHRSNLVVTVPALVGGQVLR